MKLADLYSCITAIYRAGWNAALEGKPFTPLESDRDAIDSVLNCLEGQDSGSHEIDDPDANSPLMWNSDVMEK